MKKFLLAAASLSLVGALYGCNNDSDCSDNNDCPTNQICSDEGVCVSGGNTDTCVMDEECTGGYSCNLTTELCNTSCTSTEDHCAGGYSCDSNGQCVSGGNAVYNRVLIVSRTPDDSTPGSDCREPNPGADIDYVELLAAGTPVAPTTAVGEHGGYCGSTAVTYWAEPSEVLERDSIPDTLPGTCELSNTPGQTSPYYFLGMGQAYEPGETLAATTGRVVVTLSEAAQDGDSIRVYEVNKADGAGGQTVCSNVDKDRPNDTYSVYLVSSSADIGDKGAGVALTAPDFIHLGERNGIAELPVVLD